MVQFPLKSNITRVGFAHIEKRTRATIGSLLRHRELPFDTLNLDSFSPTQLVLARVLVYSLASLTTVYQM